MSYCLVHLTVRLGYMKKATSTSPFGNVQQAAEASRLLPQPSTSTVAWAGREYMRLVTVFAHCYPRDLITVLSQATLLRVFDSPSVSRSMPNTTTIAFAPQDCVEVEESNELKAFLRTQTELNRMPEDELRHRLVQQYGSLATAMKLIQEFLVENQAAVDNAFPPGQPPRVVGVSPLLSESLLGQLLTR